jgi:hypothetical protein
MLAGTLALYYSDEIAKVANSQLFYPIFLSAIILISVSFLLIDKKRYRSDAL